MNDPGMTHEEQEKELEQRRATSQREGAEQKDKDGKDEGVSPDRPEEITNAGEM